MGIWAPFYSKFQGTASAPIAFKHCPLTLKVIKRTAWRCAAENFWNCHFPAGKHNWIRKTNGRSTFCNNGRMRIASPSSLSLSLALLFPPMNFRRPIAQVPSRGNGRGATSARECPACFVICVPLCVVNTNDARPCMTLPAHRIISDLATTADTGMVDP